MVFSRLSICFILCLCCSGLFCVCEGSKPLDATRISDYRKAIITGEGNLNDIEDDDDFQKIIKGIDGRGAFIQYAVNQSTVDQIKSKDVFIVYRHAHTPKSNFINPSHSVACITAEGRIYSTLIGIAFSSVALSYDRNVVFLTGDTQRNVQTMQYVFAGYKFGIDNKNSGIPMGVNKCINELQLGKYQTMNKKEVLGDSKFIDKISSLGILEETHKSIAQSFAEFFLILCKRDLVKDKCQKSINFVCSNSALMAAMAKFASESETLNIPDNLAFFVLVPDYEKNIIYMCSPKLAAEILPGLKSEVHDDFANMVQECVAKLLCIEKDAELVKKIYKEMFIQNGGKIFNLDANSYYINFGEKLSEDTLNEIKGIMYPIAQNQ